MIYTITVNPCLDALKFLQLAPGTESLVNKTYRPGDPNIHERLRPGGKGIDVSRALNCLRTQTIALGFIGDETGEIVRGLLLAEGIKNEFIDTGVETRTNIILVLQNDKTGEMMTEVRINSKGREIPANKYARLYRRWNEIRDADAVAICGSLSFQMDDRFYNSLISTIRNNNPGCVVVLDGPPQAVAEAMSLAVHRPNFIKPNLEEFNDLLRESTSGKRVLCPEFPIDSKEDYLEYIYTGAKLESPPHDITKDEVQRKWQELLEHIMYIKKELEVSVLLSLGPAGCVACAEDKGKIVHAYYPHKVNKITRVGAGDCLVAGFLSPYVVRRDLEQGLRSGVAAATARVCREEYTVGKYLDEALYRQFVDETVIDTYASEDEYSEALFLDKMPPDCFGFNRPRESAANTEGQPSNETERKLASKKKRRAKATRRPAQKKPKKKKAK